MSRTGPLYSHLSQIVKPSPQPLSSNVALLRRFNSTQSSSSSDNREPTKGHDVTSPPPVPQSQKQSQSQSQGQKKSIAQLDEELRQKMSGVAGDGGEAGIEYEDGKPVAMKRSVKNNMFRYI